MALALTAASLAGGTSIAAFCSRARMKVPELVWIARYLDQRQARPALNSSACGLRFSAWMDWFASDSYAYEEVGVIHLQFCPISRWLPSIHKGLHGLASGKLQQDLARVQHEARKPPDHCAIEANELKIFSDIDLDESN